MEKAAKWPPSEAALAECIVAWFEVRGWDVYQEVAGGGGVADIVAVMDGKVWVIECKRSFGFALLEQADRWRHVAHWCSVAIPKRKATYQITKMEHQVLKYFGVGMFIARAPYKDESLDSQVEEVMAPKTCRTVDRLFNQKPSELISGLCPEHKTFAKAGTSGGGHYTDFKRTCEILRRFVEKNPGTTIPEAIGKIEHHYSSDSSARQSMRTWIQKGIVPGLELVPDGGKLRLQLKVEESGTP